jgi:predicted dehydrogenase
MSLEAIGSRGSLSLSDPWHALDPVIRHDGRAIAIEPQNSYKLELENVGAAIRGEAEPLLGRADALGQARTLDALYRAAETGSAVQL